MSAAEHTPHELQTYDPPAELKAQIGRAHV